MFRNTALSASSRFVVMAASLLALSAYAHAGQDMAAASVDPRIYSSVPFDYHADRGIMLAVPDRTADNRILSPISNMGDARPRQPNLDRPAVRHDL